MTTTGAKITALRGSAITAAAAVDEFPGTHRLANPNTHRAYTSTIERVVARLGRDRPLAEIAEVEIGLDAQGVSLWLVLAKHGRSRSNSRQNTGGRAADRAGSAPRPRC